MDYRLIIIFSYSILLAALVGFFRYPKVIPQDRPFFYIIWLALFNEILNQVFNAVFHTNAVNCNIYVLLEAMLYCWLFFNWGSLIRTRKRLWWLLLLILAVWITDNFFLNRITHVNSLFRIFSSFILVFLAIDQINKLIVTERSRLLYNSGFLISIGLVIYFSYKAIVEVFYLIQLPFSHTFYHKINLIMYYVNLLVNLIFALATVWIPTRQKFILPS